MKQTILQKWNNYWNDNQIEAAISREEPIFFDWVGITAELIYPTFEEEQEHQPKVLQLLKYFKSQNKNYGQEGFPQTQEHFSLERDLICSYARNIAQAQMCMDVFGKKAIPGLTEAISKQLAEIDENPNRLDNVLAIVKGIKKYKLSKPVIQELARRVRCAANVPILVLPPLRLLEVTTQVIPNPKITELCNQIIELKPDWDETDPLIFWTTFSTKLAQLENKVMQYVADGVSIKCLSYSQPFIYSSAKLVQALNIELDVAAVYKLIALYPDNVETCLKACNPTILREALGQCARSNIQKLSKDQCRLVLQFIPKEAAQQIMENKLLLAKCSLSTLNHIVTTLQLRNISLAVPDLSYCEPIRQRAIIEILEAQKPEPQAKSIQSDIQLT